MTELERVRAELAAAREAGEAFEASWTRAVKCVRDREWRAALEETADEWRRAWDREPAPPAVLALAALADDPDRELAEGDRWCPECGGALPPRLRELAVYCGESCRKAAHRSRTVAA